MNYTKHYNKIMERANGRLIEGYTESHHIIPKCLGGTDNKENLAELTAEEHYVAHQLLVKMYPGHSGLASAAFLMTGGHPRGPTRTKNKVYGWLKRRLSESMKGRKFSEETREKLRISAKARCRLSPPWNTGIKTGIVTNGAWKKGNVPWNTGKEGLFLGGKHTDETKKHLSDVAKARPKVKCPHCVKIGQKNAMMQHHFDKCKFREIG